MTKEELNKNLFLAVWNNNIKNVKYCIENGADVDYMNTTGTTVLINAASKGYLDIVMYLISKGASIEVENTTGNALINASSSRHVNVVLYLIQFNKSLKIFKQKKELVVSIFSWDEVFTNLDYYI